VVKMIRLKVASYFRCAGVDRDDQQQIVSLTFSFTPRFRAENAKCERPREERTKRCGRGWRRSRRVFSESL
jgi:hypothetical protein